MEICKCGHTKEQHIYWEGACRPGFVCEMACKKFSPLTEEAPSPGKTHYVGDDCPGGHREEVQKKKQYGACELCGYGPLGFPHTDERYEGFHKFVQALDAPVPPTEIKCPKCGHFHIGIDICGKLLKGCHEYEPKDKLLCGCKTLDSVEPPQAVPKYLPDTVVGETHCMKNHGAVGTVAVRMSDLTPEIQSALNADHIVEADELVRLKERVEELEKTKNGAYLERNYLVATLARIYPSGIRKTAIEGWSEDWHGCVYIDTPWGQCSWHYHDSQAPLFADLPHYEKPWDGHSTEEKYSRLLKSLSQETKEGSANEPK